MSYKVRFTQVFFNKLYALDPINRAIIVGWISKIFNILIKNPHSIGNAVSGGKDEKWQYRFGKYNFSVLISEDENLVIFIDMRDKLKAADVLKQLYEIQ